MCTGTAGSSTPLELEEMKRDRDLMQAVEWLDTMGCAVVHALD